MSYVTPHRARVIGFVVAVSLAASLSVSAAPVRQADPAGKALAWISALWQRVEGVLAPVPTGRGTRPKTRDGIDVVPDGKR